MTSEPQKKTKKTEKNPNPSSTGLPVQEKRIPSYPKELTLEGGVVWDKGRQAGWKRKWYEIQHGEEVRERSGPREATKALYTGLGLFAEWEAGFRHGYDTYGCQKKLRN